MNPLRRMLGMAPSRECAYVGKAVQRFLDGEIDDETRLRVSAHLDDCRHCGLEADVYRRLKEAVARQGDPDPEAMDRLKEFVDRLARGDVPVDVDSD